MAPSTAGRARDLAAVAVASAVSAGATAWLRRYPPGGPQRWTRTNHAGAPVSLLEGPGVIAGAAAGCLLRARGGDAGAGLVAVLGAGAAGILDDLAGDASAKGLRGHLGAARRGEVTTGLVKIVVLAGSGLAAAARLDATRRDRALDTEPLDTERLGTARRRGMSPRAPRATLMDTLAGGAVIAGSANLANLLDLRPGRTLKATLLASAPLLVAGPAPAAASAAGSALGALREDLAGRTMLGDGGANPLGALVGTAVVGRSGRRGRLLALSVLSALTIASERISFSAVIADTPILRELDAWGRADTRGTSSAPGATATPSGQPG